MPFLSPSHPPDATIVASIPRPPASPRRAKRSRRTVAVYFVYPETKGPTLEEIGKIFDGEEAVAHISMKEVEREIEEREVIDDKLPQVAEKRV